MSYQTKEQSLGYILRAVLDVGSNTKELKNIYYKVLDIVEDHIKVNGSFQSIGNYETHNFIITAMRELDIEYNKIGMSLNWVYNDFTVAEAGEFYNSFKNILRVMQ